MCIKPQRARRNTKINSKFFSLRALRELRDLRGEIILLKIAKM
jgi:hypothetical protein